jgi:AAA ATPase domain
VRAHAAPRPSLVASRFEALHATGLSALVGREEELELLLRRWTKAKNSEGQVVLLSGEAGIGKSRLTAALLERITDEPHTRVRYFCSPQHTDSVFFPIIGQIRRAAGLTHEDIANPARQARSPARAELYLQAVRGTHCRAAISAERRTLSRVGTDAGAAPTTNAGSTHFTSAGPNAAQTGPHDRRGRTLDRPQQPGGVQSGRGPDRDASRVVGSDVSARVRAALDWAASRNSPHPQSANSARSRRDD